MSLPATTVGSVREAHTAHVAAELLPRASLLTRLIFRELDTEISRTEAGVLNTLAVGPRRITELAELEGLAQPTMTLLVQRLEQRGWVTRGRDPDDGRAVLASATPAGAAVVDEFRAQAGAALRAHLDEMSDEQIAALETATDALGALLGVVQGG